LSISCLFWCRRNRSLLVVNQTRKSLGNWNAIVEVDIPEKSKKSGSIFLVSFGSAFSFSLSLFPVTFLPTSLRFAFGEMVTTRRGGQTLVSASTGGTELGNGAGAGGDQRKRGRGGTDHGDYEDQGGTRVSLHMLIEWVKLGSDMEFARVQTRSGPSSQRRRITKRGTVRSKLYFRDYQTFHLTSSTIVSLSESYYTGFRRRNPLFEAH
jgi:hypothetical protein